MDIPKEKRKKKKVAKQFISFDDDDSILSSSIPSSSSSITSENTQENMSSNKTKLTTEKPSLNENTQTKSENDASKTELKQRLSPLQTKQSEKEEPKRRFSSLDGPLTPVTTENIGELTPVSVETIKSPECLDNSSDDTLEVSTDIVAVMDVVESKSKEEIEALQQTVNDLLKENENLRERIGKFESVKVEGEGESLRDVDDNVPDYKSEAKFFESKLLQVSILINIFLKI